jgi:putative hemolysin
LDTGTSRDNDIFRLSLSFSDPLRKKLAALLQDKVESALMLRRLNDIYTDIKEKSDTSGFIKETLEKLNTSFDVSQDDLASIPREGPLLVVANHPFGGVEGLILCSLLLKVRPDVKIMANYLLGRIPELRSILLCVDPFGTKTAVRKNLKPLKDGMAWVKQGHVLAVFPAGEVSHLDLGERRITDPKWHHMVARIARATDAQVLPVFFEGSNSALFQMAGAIHPKLRTALLPRELLNKKKKSLRVRIGNIIPVSKIEMFNDDEKLVSYFRMRTYALKHRSSQSSNRRPLMFPKKDVMHHEDIIDKPDDAMIRREVTNLPDDQLLVKSEGFAVYHAKAHQIPNLLYEIGRLREITFRKAGEGTGKKVDLDRYDLYYTHLFVWNIEKQEVVGAYRLGMVDTILQRFGKVGLYTSSLFDYRESLFEHLRAGIELGRSFVREEYQRHYSPLLLLWKGITRFMGRNPRYTILFGPVTISNTYTPLSRELMSAYLTVNHYVPDLARLIKPKTPLKHKTTKRLGFDDVLFTHGDLEDLSSLISDIESDRKGIPILLKQYMRLGGKLMGFNIDPHFGNGLDGLIMVDLLKCDRKVLDRYMGKSDAEAFTSYHESMRRDLAS